MVKSNHKQGTPWTFNEIKQVLKDHKSSFKPLFSHYKGQRYFHKWLCLKCNYSFFANWKRMWKTVRGVHKGGCLKCAEREGYSISKIKADLRKNKRPIICLSKEYKNNKYLMDWKCKDCGYQWKISWKAIKGTRSKGSGPHGCIVCAKNVKYTIPVINKIVKEREMPLKLISKEYINNTSNNLKWQCLTCDGIWKTSWARINCFDAGCPMCSTEGKTEKKITSFLNKVFGKKSFIKIKPEFLRNPQTGFKLEIDAYSKNLNLAIEINGDQHYIFSKFFHQTMEKFLKIKERDLWKKEQIKKQNINFIVLDIRIRNLSKIKSLLRESLVKLGYKIPKKFDELKIK